MQTLAFVDAQGTPIPAHFHITELGLTTKDFMDCGGVFHHNQFATLQIWVAEDYGHRFSPEKFVRIIDMWQKQPKSQEDLELEVEYQTLTIGRYGLGIKDGIFQLLAKETDCLAAVKCNIPQKGKQICAPDGGCC